jgi:enoyl-CoA hydratase
MNNSDAKMETCLELSREGAVAHLRFIRPDRANAMMVQFWRDLPQFLETCARDPKIRVMIISGAGKHFCSGMDLPSFRLMAQGQAAVDGSRWRANFRQNLMTAQAALSQLEALRFPVIAAVQGACLGAAIDLLCACDIRYAARDAYFAVSETNIGIVPDAGTLPRLMSLLPDSTARELVFSGRRMDAEEAERRGFVSRLFNSGDAALAAARELADQIAAKSPTAIWGSKEMMNYGRDHTTADTLRYIAAWQAGIISFEDIETSIVAQQAKRAPAYADVHLTRDLFAPHPET